MKALGLAWHFMQVSGWLAKEAALAALVVAIVIVSIPLTCGGEQ